MNIRKQIAVLTILSTGMIPSSYGLGKFSMDRVYSWFGKYKHENVTEKEYQIAKPATLTIKNTDGDIIISTEWKRNTVCLKAVTRTAQEEDLKTFSINANRDEQAEGNHLTLATVCSSKEAKGAVTYHLIVPCDISLNLHTDNGEIKVHDVNGPVAATTNYGNIYLKNVANIITAQTQEAGSISIEKAQGNIKATTNKGDIAIAQANKSVIASTNKGNISTSFTEVPSTSRIVLNSESNGSITLAMPTSVNATLQGKTAHGRLTSDHYVTLKPFTTKLNSQTIRDFKRSVDGIIGTGEATIQLTSGNGNIKIVETRTT